MAKKGHLFDAAPNMLLCMDNQALNSQLFGGFKC